jgi:hypothetical protein
MYRQSTVYNVLALLLVRPTAGAAGVYHVVCNKYSRYIQRQRHYAIRITQTIRHYELNCEKIRKMKKEQRHNNLRNNQCSLGLIFQCLNC